MLRILSGLFVAALITTPIQAQDRKPLPQYVPSKIVWVSPDQNQAVIRVGLPGARQNVAFELGDPTRFWGQTPGLNRTGLYILGGNNGNSAGVVWFQRGLGHSSSTVVPLRPINPELPLSGDGK